MTESERSVTRAAWGGAGWVSAVLLCLAVLLVFGKIKGSPSWETAMDGLDLEEHEQAVLTAHWQASVRAHPDVSLVQIEEIASPSLRRLFPDDRFFRVAYRTSGNGFRNRSSVAGVVRQRTIALDFARAEIAEFPKEGDQEEFGAFLAARGVRLTSEAEAELIWSALRDLRGIAGPTKGRHVRVSETRWELDRRVIDDSVYYYAVTTSRAGTVEHARLESEPTLPPATSEQRDHGYGKLR